MLLFGYFIMFYVNKNFYEKICIFNLYGVIFAAREYQQTSKHINMTFEQWIKENTGYECFTTFWMDFSIADRFGIAAVKDTYKRAFNEWKTDYRYLTELVLVLNHKIWQHYHKDDNFARLYNDLWHEADQWAIDHLKGEELSYYYNILD